MAIAPHLVEEDGELKLDVSVGQSGRRQFALSDRAVTMLVDDLGYGNRDVVPWVTTKTLALGGGAYLYDEKTDARELAWSITGADGGKRASEAELQRLAEYLTSVEIDQHAVETVEEHVRESPLSRVMSPDDLRSKRQRMNGLRGIAKDL
ncbi:hypothetical protein GJ631_07440 [Natronomonas sp. CBA1123]|jgi:hypothetical protein|uniref:hypothetical protein n=1 Tax=Natronomonas sp. CBA1123 TaxID=2668070 RepID=UPI0012E9E718|nr:hypothetical protein [Natronomonas sp. CBA1123]MUV86407.1 hypothetical protein [Natronomonas sp. CBA1123]